MGDLDNLVYLKARRRKLRQNQTSEESVLWFHLRNRKLGFKFRRQHSFSNFILDFYCMELKLAIELDGHYHYTKEGIAKDEKRDQFLKKHGITILRIENKHIRENLSVVLGLIEELCNELKA